MLDIASIKWSITGNIVLFRASFNISAWARLLISSDVQAKWKNSSTFNDNVIVSQSQNFQNNLRTWGSPKKQDISASVESMNRSQTLNISGWDSHFCFKKYSTAFTSWFVTFSIFFIANASPTVNPSTIPCKKDTASLLKVGTSLTSRICESFSNHWTWETVLPEFKWTFQNKPRNWKMTKCELH